MRKPRLFISHSARGDPPALDLLNGLRTALENDYAVLVDKDNLVPGDPWRQTLNTWIGGCDAAIVLVTSKALASPYVAYEVTVLTYRRALPDHNCLVVPVFIDPVTDETVRAVRAFEPLQLTELQAVKGKHEDIAALVRQRLVPPQAPAVSPLDAQETWLTDLLTRKVPEPVVLTALDTFQVELEGWTAEPCRSLALALLSHGLDRLTIDFVLTIRSYLNDRLTLETLFEMLATSWIDLRSARCLEKIARGARERRVVALDASSDFVARKYVQRAGNRPPSDSWPLAPVTAVFSEAALDPLQREIERSLRQEIRLGQDDDLQDSLEWSDENAQPVFVALPAAGVTPGILAQLRARFPTVTFFLLAGGVVNAVEAQSIELLEPRLTPGFDEPGFIKQYKRDRLGAVDLYLRQHGL